MDIGNNIRILRKAKGMTQEQLASSAGLSRSYIADLERNRYSNPGIDIVAVIAKALDVQPSKIIDCDCQTCSGDKMTLKVLQQLVEQFYRAADTTATERDALFKFVSDLYWRYKK